MEDWEGWLHASWTLWRHWTIPHGVMVLDMITASLSKSSETVIRFRFLISGWAMETLGRLKESTFSTRLDSMEKCGNQSMRRENKDQIGRIARLLLHAHTILQFQGMQPSIRSALDFGSPSLQTSSTSLHLTVENIIKPYKQGKKQNTSQVCCIPMTQLSKASNFV